MILLEIRFESGNVKSRNRPYAEVSTNKKIINPYELDIYLPDSKLAFEFNGLYWHSESQKGKNYHQIKTKNVFSTIFISFR